MVKNKLLSINSPASDIKGVGPKKLASLEKLGIRVVSDFLYHFPRSYEDFRNVKNICELNNEEKVLVRARILLKTFGRGYGRKRNVRLLCEDSTGRMEVLFFSAGYMYSSFETGSVYNFFGKVKNENGRVTMFHPTYSLYTEDSEQGIVPVYPLSKGLNQKDMRAYTKAALGLSSGMEETLPEKIINDYNLCGIFDALCSIHYPKDEAFYKTARYRLIFEELFDLKTAILLSKDRFGSGRKGNVIKSGGADKLLSALPYRLTGAQNRVLSEILSDMHSGIAMNRLVQGDVGSGKTAIAMAAVSEAVFAGFQAAFMAPTEILSKQHYNTLKKAFSGLGVKADLLISSLSAAEKKDVLSRLSSGETDVVVGTHALLSDKVIFDNLGLVITDEQHRFGVGQRKKLSEKAENPDVLIMTATPIPRTLAVVLYADLDVSVIDELPPGRQKIETLSFDEAGRKKAYEKLLSEVNAGRQAYIVAPFIDEPEGIDAYSAESLFEEFRKKYPKISCGLLHGEMNKQEKDSVMEQFQSGSLSVLISTVVIEVGIDVPNATVMLIENSERFGLAQMHQLRGRVGRGSEKSYCLLVIGDDSGLAKERADILCQSSDGIYISEKDLELRGPGEFFGFRQHGLPQLSIADPVKHAQISEKAGKAAAELLSDDPMLNKEENKAFCEKIRRKFNADEELVL